jgi:hypothetical protein
LLDQLGDKKVNKNSLEWIKIRGNTGYWFSPSSMAFFGTRVNWNTLTEIPSGYLFVSSDQDYSGVAWNGERRYTVRLVNRDYGIQEIGEYNQFGSLKEAKKALADYVAEHNTKKEFKFYFLTGSRVFVTAANLEQAEQLLAEGKYEFQEAETRLEGVY